MSSPLGCWRHAALAALVLLASTAAAAQGPPDPSSVPDASFSEGSVAFSEGSVGFSEGSIGFSEGSVDFPTGTVAAPAEESGSELRFQLKADLLFDFDKADLRPQAQDVLQGVTAKITSWAKRPRVRVEGHTDAKGTDEHNQDLSERRASSVKAWLVEAGLPQGSVSTLGLGEGNPVAPNETPEGQDDPKGRQQNRRVEIIVSTGS